MKHQPENQSLGHPFELPDFFEFNRLYGNEKYSLRNMLLKAANFPYITYPGDEVWEQWSDRLYSEMEKAHHLLRSTASGDAFFHGATDKSFLAFMSSMAGFEATGACVIRFTNVSSGYPCLRFTTIKADPKHGQRMSLEEAMDKASPEVEAWGMDGYPYMMRGSIKRK